MPSRGGRTRPLLLAPRSIAPVRRDGSQQPAARRTLARRRPCSAGPPCPGLAPPPPASPHPCRPSPQPKERPGSKAGWPSQQPAGTEPAKTPLASLPASPQAGLALAASSRLAGCAAAWAAEVAAPRPERACLRSRVGLALPFAKAIAPRRRTARQAQGGAGQRRVEQAGAGGLPSRVPRPAFQPQARSAPRAPKRRAQPVPATRISPRSRRSPRRARAPRA